MSRFEVAVSFTIPVMVRRLSVSREPHQNGVMGASGGHRGVRKRIEENSGGRKNRTIIQNGRVSTEIYFYFTTPFSIYHTTPHNTHPFSFITCPCIYLIAEDLSHKRTCHMPMAFATGLTGLSHLRRLVTTMSRSHTVAHGGIEADRSH